MKGLSAAVRAAEQRLDGRIGLAARHLETGLSVGINAGERFPMASTYKVPMAGLLLHLVDLDDLSLDTRVEITSRHRAETGEIAQSVIHPGVSLSALNLLELMLTQSNNNATDRVLELIGGPDAVTAWLRASGIDAMRVDHSVNDLLGKFYDLPPGTPAMEGFLAKWPDETAREAVNGRSSAAFDDGAADSATPAAMVDLLAALFGGDLISPASREILHGVMLRCQTGEGRIKGMLPPGTPVAHKTGTIGGTINDAGIIQLPERRGRLALAIYTKGSTILRYIEREPIMADVARSVYDAFALGDLA
jgi:beta-lactamase class A